MIKIIKRRKNPNLQGESFIQEFMDSLMAAFSQPTAKQVNKFISDALISLNIGHFDCQDCDKNWSECKCEYCQDCDQRICACNRNTLDKSRKFIIHLVTKYLTKDKQLYFLEYLKLLNDDFRIIENDRSLEKYIKILRKSINKE